MRAQGCTDPISDCSGLKKPTAGPIYAIQAYVVACLIKYESAAMHWFASRRANMALSHLLLHSPSCNVQSNTSWEIFISHTLT